MQKSAPVLSRLAVGEVSGVGGMNSLRVRMLQSKKRPCSGFVLFVVDLWFWIGTAVLLEIRRAGLKPSPFDSQMQ